MTRTVSLTLDINCSNAVEFERHFRQTTPYTQNITHDSVAENEAIPRVIHDIRASIMNCQGN